ncbi:MAG: AAA family ATPase [Candidatus Brocadiaceae bacterium]|nr:AAA family ATPase [Candidatus Brocadiaceae bacterium]
MKKLYIGSMKRFSGKNIFTLGLALDLKEKGYQIGYIKPVGKSPINHEGETVDADALFFAETLCLKEAVTTLSPFVFTFDTIHSALSGRMKGPGEEILSAIKSIKGKDVLLIAGTTDIFEGSIFGINGISIVKNTDSRALVVESWKDEDTINGILGAREIFAEDLLGVVINEVREELVDFMTKNVVPYLKSKGIDVFGIIPTDPLLRAVSVATLTGILGGKVLCAEDRLDEMVEHFSIGAMEVNNAHKFYHMSLTTT